MPCGHHAVRDKLRGGHPIPARLVESLLVERDALLNALDDLLSADIAQRHEEIEIARRRALGLLKAAATQGENHESDNRDA